MYSLKNSKKTLKANTRSTIRFIHAFGFRLPKAKTVKDQIRTIESKMTRSWVLLFVLMFIVLTSQFEWKEQLESEVETNRPLILSDKEQHIPQGRESVQEKKILSQEKNIQKLNELVQDLRRQLLQCRNENQVELTELVTELDQLPLSGV